MQLHGSAKFNLAVDSGGMPRMGVYSGTYSYDPFQAGELYYLWCEAGCVSAGDWSFTDAGLASGAGDGVDLALDGQDRPRLSFETAGQGLGYAWCDANCQSDQGAWQSQ